MSKNNIFGEFIRKRRKERKKTLKNVAAAIGRSIGYVHDLESGARRPPVRTPEKFVVLANYLGIPLDLLLEKAGVTIDVEDKNSTQYMKIIKNRAVATFFSSGMARLRGQLAEIEANAGDANLRKMAKNALETMESIEANLKSAA